MSRSFAPIIPGESMVSGAQVIDGSLKFDGYKSQYIEKAYSSAGNQKTATFSCWLKRTKLGSNTYIFDSNSTNTTILLNPDNRLTGNCRGTGGTNYAWQTSAQLRDANGWYHIVVAWDTREGTAADGSGRLRVYINGEQQTFYSVAYPSSELVLFTNDTRRIGVEDGGSLLDYLNAYVAQAYFIDGQALGPGAFGYRDPLTNTWRPRRNFQKGSLNHYISDWSSYWATSASFTDPTNLFDGVVGSSNETYSRGGANNIPAIDVTIPEGSVGVQDVYISANMYLDSYAGANPSSSTEGFVTVTATIDGKDVVKTYTDATAPAAAGTFNGRYWQNFGYFGTGVVSRVQVKTYAGWFYMAAIKVNGCLLQNGVTVNNSSYLPFDGNSPIGEDQFKNGNDWTSVNFSNSAAVDKATGGLPILEGAGGKVATVNVRSDSAIGVGSCVLALPLVGNANDVSNQINSGSSTKTITAVGNASASSAQSNFYGGSYYFDNAGDYLSVSSTTDFDFGTGDYTAESWVYLTTTGDEYVCNMQTNNTGSPAPWWGINFYSTNLIRVGRTGDSNGDPEHMISYNFTTNRWYHIAVSRESGVSRVFLDGVKIDEQNVNRSVIRDGNFNIGAYYNGGLNLGGYLQDFRIYKGVAKYTSNFVPASTNPDIIPDTPSGVSGSSKLTESAGGSVYFDGTGDYLTIPNSTDFNFGSGDFTIECYAYFTSVSAETLLGQWENGTNRRSWLLQVNSGQLSCYLSADGTTTGQKRIDSAAGAITTNRWYHLAYARSGNTMRLFIDGTEVGSVDVTGFTNYANTQDTAQVGSQTNAGSNLMTGYISNARIIKGTGLYTSDFTPPSRKLSNVTNTKLLTCQSNTTTGGAAVSPNLGGINNGTVWSDYLSISSGGVVSNEPADAFSGYTWDFSDAANSGYSNDNTGNYIRFDPPGGTLVGQVVKLYQRIRPSTVTVNGTTATITTDGNTRICTVDLGSSQPITSVITTATTDGQTNAFGYLEVDGVRVKDPISSFGDRTVSLISPVNTDINTVRGQETNYATWDPITVRTGAGTLQYWDGNLSFGDRGSASTYGSTLATMSFDSGKWYFEITFGSGTGVDGNVYYGILPIEEWSAVTSVNIFNTCPSALCMKGGDTAFRGDNSSDNTYGTGANIGDTFGFAVDVDNLSMEVNRNGNSFGKFPYALASGKTWTPFATDWSNGQPVSDYAINCGQKPFRSAPPEGYKTLNAANLRPETVIVRPDQYVGVTTYVGNGVIRSFNVGHQPDLVWIKRYVGSASHELYDTIRGAQNALYSNLTNAQGENTGTNGLLGFERTGFQIGTGGGVNAGPNAYVGLCWKAGGNSNTFNVDGRGYASAAAAGITEGDLALSGASIGTKQGFSIVKFAITTSADTISTFGHGLSQSPDFVVIKPINSTDGGWTVYHSSLPNPLNNWLRLDTASASGDGTLTFSNSSTVFGIRESRTLSLGTSANLIAYCWHDVPGMCKTGKYIGNGSTDGAFQECGFRPKIVLIKSYINGSTANGTSWTLFNTEISKYNQTASFIEPDQANGQVTSGDQIDILSNGFKPKEGNTQTNHQSNSYVWIAWAEAPTFNLYGAQSNAR